NDEVFFRDTAHGFLAWCLAAVVTAAFLATAATVMMSAATAGATAAEAMSPANAAATSESDYYLDMMFRTDNGRPLDPVTRAEALRIFMSSLAKADVPAEDRDYLARLVAARAGIGVPEAQLRVTDAYTRARQALDTARKAAAH